MAGYRITAHGWHHGQSDRRVVAIDARGRDLGHADIAVTRSEMAIQWIEVDPAHRREGVGLGIVAAALDHQPLRPVRFGPCSAPGAALAEAWYAGDAIRHLTPSGRSGRDLAWTRAFATGRSRWAVETAGRPMAEMLQGGIPVISDPDPLDRRRVAGLTVTRTHMPLGIDLVSEERRAITSAQRILERWTGDDRAHPPVPAQGWIGLRTPEERARARGWAEDLLKAAVPGRSPDGDGTWTVLRTTTLEDLADRLRMRAYGC